MFSDSLLYLSKLSFRRETGRTYQNNRPFNTNQRTSGIIPSTHKQHLRVIPEQWMEPENSDL